MNGMRPNLLLKGNGSPIVNPIVIRPGTGHGQGIFNSPTPSHASASMNASLLNPKPTVSKDDQITPPAFQKNDNFNADKIN
jgi:hypothetical protein